MMDESSSRVLEPLQNPNPNYIPFPYTYVYNPTPLQTYHPQEMTLPEVATQLNINENGNKAPKKVKIVQSLWCEVCKISCNSKDVFDSHKLGKKHKKNLEKLNSPTPAIPAPVVVFTSTPTTISNVHPLIGPQENPTKVSLSVHPLSTPIIGPQENPANVPLSKNAVKSKKKKLASTEDIDSKRRKVLDGGAAAEAVRTCTYCNVVCNSETVFNYHMAGQKHAATMKKYAAAMTGISFVSG